MNEFFMKRAIELAKKGAGFVNPDPLSGAVVVKDNKIIGEGHYKAYGNESAENAAVKNALKNTAGDIAGAEIYLNIEPFQDAIEVFNWIELIEKAGITKIYLGILNNNPDKKIDLLNLLRAKGIVLEIGLLQEECEELNEIYSYYITNKLPYVITKWAMTLDGKLASRTGDSKWISSDDSLRFVHELRQRVAAIMVGENTVKLDDPLLTTRLEGVEISNPLRIILSKYGDLPLPSKVLSIDEKTKTIIIASEHIPKDKAEVFQQRGIPVIKLEEKNHKIDFKDIVKVLGAMEIDSLFLEGGSSVMASAFESGVVNKVYTTIAPKIIGGKDAITPVGGLGIERMRDAILLKRVSHEIIGTDIIVKGYI